jgi:hypothetical protein
VPVRYRTLVKKLFVFCGTKNLLTNSQFDLLTQITDQNPSYIRKGHKEIILKTLKFLWRQRKKTPHLFYDSGGVPHGASDFTKSLNRHQELKPEFKNLFSMEGDYHLHFGINYSSQTVIVYTDRVADMKKAAEDRIDSCPFLNNLDFVQYEFMNQPPSIKIESRSELHAGSSLDQIMPLTDEEFLMNNSPTGTIGTFAQLKYEDSDVSLSISMMTTKQKSLTLRAWCLMVSWRRTLCCHRRAIKMEMIHTGQVKIVTRSSGTARAGRQRRMEMNPIVQRGNC